jgi:hypothetical protein
MLVSEKISPTAMENVCSTWALPVLSSVFSYLQTYTQQQKQKRKEFSYVEKDKAIFPNLQNPRQKLALHHFDLQHFWRKSERSHGWRFCGGVKT